MNLEMSGFACAGNTLGKARLGWAGQSSTGLVVAGSSGNCEGGSDGAAHPAKGGGVSKQSGCVHDTLHDTHQGALFTGIRSPIRSIGPAFTTVQATKSV